MGATVCDKMGSGFLFPKALVLEISTFLKILVSKSMLPVEFCLSREVLGFQLGDRNSLPHPAQLDVQVPCSCPRPILGRDENSSALQNAAGPHNFQNFPLFI